ncbi:predicted NAD/FAD-dependent oxidoreductase [Chthonomonas calidirosea]|uniref:Predicted NAD/FAD-dependent oxidoreductase n=1 Tax=Chthonomonas calidirosea (strain DSM 23976 / ICMP 18418 / T49) TaxID=1303518 RepID=S0EYI2_CHTCT|nr:FAD-dependent oxidoreductase [Chthonomonas calidirosea]CCW34937.1 Predicted NAD/FAD-dependent oxidoreductase [Chthonomonas calidirosea T49]CEK13362.1 predicted NAD/FAD-dependent oxidoreductase [Chthonomonas calidirosea]
MTIVAIVGAGITGLSAAQALLQCSEGIQVHIYEKSRGIGGRVATRRIEGCIVDHGAQNIKTTEPAFVNLLLEELDTADLVPIVAPVRLWRANGEILPPDPRHEAISKYAYRYGLTTLAKLLLARLPKEWIALHLETPVARLAEEGEEVVLKDGEGRELMRADFAVLTAPLPQAASLLAESALWMRGTQQTLDRVRALREVEYVPCLSVLLGYGPGLPEPPAYALLAEDRSETLLWLAFEHLKAPERAPHGESLLVAQWGPAMSRVCFEEAEAMVVGRTLNELKRLFGETYERPLWVQVKRWRYSQPRGMMPFEMINPPAVDSLIYVAGDGTRPEGGRIHQAYLSGLETAEAILARIGGHNVA